MKDFKQYVGNRKSLKDCSKKKFASLNTFTKRKKLEALPQNNGRKGVLHFC